MHFPFSPLNKFILITLCPLFFMVSCNKEDPEGACEQRIVQTDRTTYRCQIVSEEICDGQNNDDGDGFTSEVEWYEGRSCEDLGYTLDSGGLYYASEDALTPGAGGAWAGAGGGGGGNIGSYDYTFTCPATGIVNTVPIPEDGCEEENEYYARTFVCNDVANFYDACREYFGCNGQVDISFCDVYL